MKRVIIKMRVKRNIKKGKREFMVLVGFELELKMLFYRI